MAINWTSITAADDCWHDYHPTYSTGCPLNKSWYCHTQKTLKLRFAHSREVTFPVKDKEHAERIIRAIEGEEI